jgi:hypothetical protein
LLQKSCTHSRLRNVSPTSASFPLLSLKWKYSVHYFVLRQLNGPMLCPKSDRRGTPAYFLHSHLYAILSYSFADFKSILFKKIFKFCV